MKKLLIIFTITVFISLNLYSWNSQNISLVHSKLDPAWVLNEKDINIINNPFHINNLQGKFLNLGLGVNSASPKHILYAHNFNKYKLAFFAGMKSIYYFEKTNYSNFTVVFGSETYGLTYSYFAGEKNISENKETDQSTEETEIEEPVWYVKNKNSNLEESSSKHTLKYGLFKELESSKKIDFVVEAGIGLFHSESESSTHKFIDRDPDDDGEMDGVSSGYVSEDHRRFSLFDSDYTKLMLSASVRIQDDRYKKKRKSLSFGLGIFSHISDNFKGSTKDTLSTYSYEDEELFFEKSTHDYNWEERSKQGLTGFIGIGTNWDKGKNWNTLVSTLLKTEISRTILTADCDEKKDTTEFDLKLSSYVSTKYKITNRVKALAGFGLTFYETSQKVIYDTTILNLNETSNISLCMDTGFLVGLNFNSKKNVELNFSYSTIETIQTGDIFLEMKYIF